MKKRIVAVAAPLLLLGAVAAHAGTVTGFFPHAGTPALRVPPAELIVTPIDDPSDEPVVVEQAEVAEPMEETPVVGVTPPEGQELAPVEYVPSDVVVGVTPPEGQELTPVEYVPEG